MAEELLLLKILVICTLGVTILLLILVAFLIFQVTRISKANKSSKNPKIDAKAKEADLPEVATINNANIHNRNRKYEKSGTTTPVYSSKSGDHSYSSTNSSATATTGSTITRREPSESTLPHYTYDNPNLVPSPVHM
jgi:Na+-transporting methylmalonyl-CoA/oxaloacetate decarboxylase gamma subunit